jgi:hypothetical protein
MEKEILTTKLLKKEIIDKNECAIRIFSDYIKVIDIIERTYVAMGRKATYKVINSSTVNGKFNPHVLASTH